MLINVLDCIEWIRNELSHIEDVPSLNRIEEMQKKNIKLFFIYYEV